ncbi:MAG: DUF3124 domain-containing protein [Magnetococcales bacterium]|nr:DUF3124 domain-containing protein [Magnetococcales bacterium]
MPVYSSVSHGNVDRKGEPEKVLLSSMLSVRNVDLNHSLTITSVRYYDTVGRLLREYIKTPLPLPRLASMDFFVENLDDQGGTGANFIVEWRAAQPINQPILETVHVYHWGTKGQSFISRGQVVHAGKSAANP